MIKTAKLILPVFLFGFVVCGVSAQTIQKGQALAFMGDSITSQGAGSQAGYVNLVISGLKTNGINIKAIPAGISGHKSNQMLERLDRDVIKKKPDWMTLSCGVNDVWHGANGVPLDDYKKNITAIVNRAQQSGIKVMILTATMITEDQSKENNQKLQAYNDFLRKLAVEKQCLLADLNADMQAEIQKRGGYSNQENRITNDGVHMNPNGDRMMARGILRTFGLNDVQVTAAEKVWLTLGCPVYGNTGLTLAQYDRLSAVAAQKRQPLPQMLDKAFKETIDRLLSVTVDK
jgi:lysophospholipase L1-like esterase